MDHYGISNDMISHRILWKDSIDLIDDGTKILAGNALIYLNIDLESVINFNVDFHNSENDMLDWQQAIKAKSLVVDPYIEKVGPWVFKKSRLARARVHLRRQAAFACLKKLGFKI